MISEEKVGLNQNNGMNNVLKSEIGDLDEGTQTKNKLIMPQQYPPLNFIMTRSQSECQLRDKEFYDMCDEEDEIAMYCKFAEQNILDAIHISHARNLS